MSFTYKDGSDVIAAMERLQTCAMVVMDAGAEGEKWAVFRNLVDSVSPDGTAQSKQMPYLRYVFGHEVGTSFMTDVKRLSDLISDDDISDDITLPEVTEDDITFLFQTSGSTGVPKLVAHTNRSILNLRRLCKDNVIISR